MDMKIIKCVNELCVGCMTVHDVKIVEVMDWNVFKEVGVEYKAQYEYCDKADEYYANEEQMNQNDINLKNAYRRKMGLLTSDDIVSIRNKYGISQGDLCTLLGWGGKTITRYESHQVQDKAHDSILRKLNDDPEWFLSLLSDDRGTLSEFAFKKYNQTARELYEESKDLYLRKAIEADYLKYQDETTNNGNTELSLIKAVEDIIKKLSGMAKDEIVEFMNDETAILENNK